MYRNDDAKNSVRQSSRIKMIRAAGVSPIKASAKYKNSFLVGAGTPMARFPCHTSRVFFMGLLQGLWPETLRLLRQESSGTGSGEVAERCITASRSRQISCSVFRGSCSPSPRKTRIIEARTAPESPPANMLSMRAKMTTVEVEVYGAKKLTAATLIQAATRFVAIDGHLLLSR